MPIFGPFLTWKKWTSKISSIFRKEFLICTPVILIIENRYRIQHYHRHLVYIWESINEYQCYVKLTIFLMIELKRKISTSQVKALKTPSVYNIGDCQILPTCKVKLSTNILCVVRTRLVPGSHISANEIPILYILLSIVNCWLRTIIQEGCSLCLVIYQRSYLNYS